MPLTSDEIQQYKDKFGDVAHVRDSYDRFEFILRTPTPEEFMLFKRRVGSDATKDAATSNLIRSLVVFPDREAFENLARKYPGMCDSDGAQNAVKYLTGMSSEVASK